MNDTAIANFTLNNGVTLPAIDALNKGVRGGPDPDQPQPKFLGYQIPDA